MSRFARRWSLRVGHLLRDKWTALSGPLLKVPNHPPWSRRGHLLSSQDSRETEISILAETGVTNLRILKYAW